MCEHQFVRRADATKDEITYAIDQLRALRQAVYVEELLWVAELDRRDAYREDGSRSMADWLTYRYGLKPDTGREEVRLARALEQLPSIAAGVTDGSISWDKFVELSTFVEPKEDEAWAEKAVVRTWGQVHSAAVAQRGLRRERAEAELNARYFRARQNDDGSMRGSFRLPAAEGATVLTALDRLVTKHVDPVGGWEPLEKQRADALVELAGVAVANDADIDRATVVISVTARDLNHINGSASLMDGGYVPSEVARRLACDGRIEVVTTTDDGTPIGIGRKSRIVPPWLARQVKLRDRGCVVCGQSYYLQSHHKRHWAHGAPTDLDELVTLCWKCHRLVHEGRHKLVQDLEGTYQLISPDGRVLNRRPAKLRNDVAERMLGPPVPVS